MWKYSLSDGKSRFLLNNMFGYVDNVKFSDTGDLLLSMIITRDFLSEFIKDKPRLRTFLMNFPEKLSMSLMKKRAGGIRVDPSTGEIKEYMFGAPTKISFVSAINERNGKTYFSSLKNPTIVVLDRSSHESQKKEKVESSEL